MIIELTFNCVLCQKGLLVYYLHKTLSDADDMLQVTAKLQL